VFRVWCPRSVVVDRMTARDDLAHRCYCFLGFVATRDRLRQSEESEENDTDRSSAVSPEPAI
jgi:hypothetical protein